jgi:hypothetical protein
MKTLRRAFRTAIRKSTQACRPCPLPGGSDDYGPAAALGDGSWLQSDDRPPFPDTAPILPDRLYYLERTWNSWQGSPARIAQLAKRAGDYIDSQFTDWPKLPRERWYLPGGRLAQQHAVFNSYTVVTPWSARGVKVEELAAEIEVRPDQVTIVQVDCRGSWRTWPVNVFDHVPLTEAPPPEIGTPGTVTTSWDFGGPPQRIEIEFLTRERPAVRLRVTARTPDRCRALLNHMERYVASGARSKVWPRKLAGLLGAGGGILAGLTVGFVVQGAIGFLAGVVAVPSLGLGADWLMGWLFPPLEIVESWDARRWAVARRYAWQGVLFSLAVAGVLVAVLLAPSGGTNQ